MSYYVSNTRDQNKHNDFSVWDPTAYLKEYFPSGVDIEPVVKLISEEGRKRLAADALAIDMGCGPTVCYWSALAPYVQEIHLADYLDTNLQQIETWLNREDGMYDWSYYTEMILKFEGTENPSQQDILKREALSRAKATKLFHCDISEADPIGASGRYQYDCLISLCCADSITQSKKKWKKYMRNTFSLLKPGGVFIGAAMRNCTQYKIGNSAYPAANINEDDFERLLIDYGFRDIKIEIASESRPIIDYQSQRTVDLRQEYDELLLVAGTLSMEI